jgi:hypothetical protein
VQIPWVSVVQMLSMNDVGCNMGARKVGTGRFCSNYAAEILL